MPLEETDGLTLGDPIVARSEDARVAVGPGLLGRVIDGFGKPIDDGPPIPPRAVMSCSPGRAIRSIANTSTSGWSTGIRAIDGLLPCGKGQRIGIFGGSGVGKSTLLGAMARHSSADVNVIALIGERNREVRAFLEHELGPGGSKRSVVVVRHLRPPGAAARARLFRGAGRRRIFSRPGRKTCCS